MKSKFPYRFGRQPSTKRIKGVHVVDTEARDFDEALDIFEARALVARRKTGKGHKPSLKEELSRAQSRARLLKAHGKISLAGGQHSARTREAPNPPKKPDPFRTLPIEEKVRLIKEWWATGNFKPRELMYRFGLSGYEVKMIIWGDKGPWIEYWEKFGRHRSRG